MDSGQSPTLGEYLSFRNGRTSPERADSGAYPVYGSNGIIGYAEVQNVELPSIVIGRVGSFCGSTYYAPDPCWVTDNAIVATPKTMGEARFWYYALTAAKLNKLRQGSGQPLLNQTILNGVRFQPPATAERLAIAAILGALDDKIESNRRALDIGFQLAAVLMLGSGGRKVRVGDVAVVDKGLSYKGSGLADDGVLGAMKMINLANFTTSGQLNPSGLKHYTGDYKPKHALSELDLVVANTDLTQAREILGRGFLIPPDLAGAIHTHHTSVVRFVNGQEWMAPFLWAQLQSSEFRERAKGFATGTTVTALPAEALLDFEFTLPPDPPTVADRALALVRHGWQLSREIDSLEALRDTLLPELLSGRIRVPEAEHAVAGVDV